MSTTLTGTDAGEQLFSTEANVTIQGFGGDDYIGVYSGANFIDGGAGNDIVQGGLGPDTIYGADGDDTIGGDDIHAFPVGTIASNDFLSGGAGNDTIHGDGALLGLEGGNDTIDGGDGNDFLWGDGGNDLVLGGAGFDTLSLSPIGSATLDGGDGEDVVQFEGNDQRVPDGALHIDLLQGTYSFAGYGHGVIRNVEDVWGSDRADWIRGDDAANVINGLYGADTLLGMGGDDTISGFGAASIDGGDGNDTIVNVGASTIAGGAGNDILRGGAATMIGGAGNDELRGDGSGASVAVFSGPMSDYAITPMSDGPASQTSGVQSEQLYVQVTDLVGGRDGSDKVFLSVGKLQFADATLSIAQFFPGVGTDSAESIAGTDGNDVLLGLGGNDTLSGAAGNDTLGGGAGDDYIDGGAGVDTASYSDAARGVTVSLAIAGAQATSGAGADTLVNIENLRGSMWNDTLTGNAGANLIEGGTGSDKIDGGAGADTMVGGAQNDTYWVDDARDVVIEAPLGGHDKVNASIAYVLPDQVEDLALLGTANLSGTGNDRYNVIVGNPGDNLLIGGAGDDTISGNAGNDVIVGGTGGDSIDGGTGYDIAVYGAQLADYTVTHSSNGVVITLKTDSSDTDSLTSIEQLEFTDARVVFDTSGSAGAAYRLYQAAFNRTPDAGGLGYQIASLEAGNSIEAVAQGFIHSPEFAAKYGDLDNTAFVKLLYQNVLHREADAQGLAFHVGNLDAGISRAVVLVGFSESGENKAAVDAMTANGIGYRPTLIGSSDADAFLVNSAARDVEGGDGVDTAVFAGARSAYQVDIHGATATVAAPDGLHTLHDVERIHFADQDLAVDIAGHAGQAYRLYQAAFERTPDVGGLTFQTYALDGGASLVQVAANFIASPEFASTYGALDNTAFVTQLYANVLHRAPDAEGLAFHVHNLDTGTSRALVLVGFSESPENQAAVIGVIEHGVALAP